MKPKRIQRRRSKGWRLPDGVVIVTRPGRWGNPHKPVNETPRARRAAVAHFRRDLKAGRLRFSEADAVRELGGHDLACWCAVDEPWCHANVLLEVANP